MKQITNPAKTAEYIERYSLRQIFDTKDLPFHLFQYDKSEIITGAWDKAGWLLFLVDGTYNVYAIHDDGSYYPMYQKSDFGIINELEFMGYKMPMIEAETPVTCLALPLLELHETLMCDNAFLRYVMQTLALKLSLANRSQGEMANVEERLLDYMEDTRRDGRLENVGAATYELHCSRRQLQRVLQRLCDEGRIRKLKKGCYELTRRTL